MTVDTFSTLKIIGRTPTVCNTGGCPATPAPGAEHCDDCLRLHEQIRQHIHRRATRYGRIRGPKTREQ